MKKVILLVTVLVGFTFAKTGMLTPADESGMGVWFNHGVWSQDTDAIGVVGGADYVAGADYEGNWTLGFDYMTGIGVEVGLNMMDGSKGLDLGYHHKMEKWNMSVSWSRMMNDDDDGESDRLWLMAYCDTALYGGLGGVSTTNASTGTTSDWEFETLTVGKIWTFDMGMSAGVSYTAVFEDIGEGELKLDLGYTF